MKRFLALLLAMLMMLTLMVGCSSSDEGGEAEGETQGDAAGGEAANDDVIRIGIFEPLSGANAAGGQMEYEGIQVAHSVKGEVLGKKIELVPVDNKSDDVEAVAAAARLVDSEKVHVVIGSWGSSVAIAAGPTFEAAKVPAIGTSCTNPNVTLGNDYYFRVCYLDDFQGTLLANYAKTNLGAAKAAVIYDVSDAYAVGLYKYFKEAFGEENIVAEAKFNKGDQDFTAQISDVMSKNPDVIFAPSGYTEAGLMMKQARELGHNEILFLGADTWETEAMIEVGGDAVEACRFTTFFDANATPTAESEEFLKAYAAMFNGEQPKGAVTALGYDAYMAAVAAIEKAGSTDGTAIRDALAALEITGVTGACKFDENGDAIKNSAVIKTVTDGKFTYVDTVVVE
ncbi:MAG: ABC transporter substrate-binding protein [Clostridia bacterium]|nr:ABC transporter substrate-binding protein [Clostridia bacterium]